MNRSGIAEIQLQAFQPGGIEFGDTFATPCGGEYTVAPGLQAFSDTTADARGAAGDEY
jgi:hypothetical protein